MTNNPKINRRDFLRIGGLTAVSLPMITKVGKMGEYDLLESPEAYGGFLVRTLSSDDSPIVVDEANYKRFDSTNVIFSRTFWDEEYAEKVRNVQTVYTAGEQGYTHFDAALCSGAIYAATYDGTGSSSAMTGKHMGLLGLEPNTMTSPQGPTFEERLDHTQYSPEEIAERVKKAALFLGASLVGIAPLNQRRPTQAQLL